MSWNRFVVAISALNNADTVKRGQGQVRELGLGPGAGLCVTASTNQISAQYSVVIPLTARQVSMSLQAKSSSPPLSPSPPHHLLFSPHWVLTVPQPPTLHTQKAGSSTRPAISRTARPLPRSRSECPPSGAAEWSLGGCRTLLD